MTDRCSAGSVEARKPIVEVNTRVRQSKVYGLTRDGKVIRSDEHSFTVVWDGVTVSCTYGAEYLTDQASCPIAILPSPDLAQPPKPYAEGAVAIWMMGHGYATDDADTLDDLLGKLVHQVHANALLEAHNVAQRKRDPAVVAAVQQAIMSHPHFVLGAATAFGLANTAIDAYTLALSSTERTLSPAEREGAT